MSSLTFFPPSSFAVFDCCHFLVIDCKELKLAQTAHFTQLFQLLKQICIHGNVFYRLPRMLMSKDVKGDFSYDSPI